VRFEAVEALSLKGKSAPVHAYRLLAVIPGAAPVARRLDSLMVGRDGELGRLLAAFEESARDSGCVLVTVLGVAGVGKSRLVHELSSALGARALFLEGRCLPYGDGITFWPVAEIVKEAAGVEPSDAPEKILDRIGALLASEATEDRSLIRDRVGAAIGLEEAGGTIQETFWAVRRLLECLAAAQPVVAVIEDLHWAEPTLLDLIHYIAAFSRDQPLLLVCTARPELRESHPEWGGSGVAISLQPLGPADSKGLAQSLLGRATLPDQVLARVLDAAEGNPLFVEEMLRMLIDQGMLRTENDHWVAASDLSEISTPGTIQGLLAARLDRLHEQERAVIQRASVVGRVFYWGAVWELSPTDARGGVGGHLQTLLRKELILPEPSQFAGEDAFRFSHALVCEAAYESMPKRLRADLHERFASWLGRLSGARVLEFEEILGYHLEQAHRYLGELGPTDDHSADLASRAGNVLASAGQRAYMRGDMRAAANLLGRATRMLPGGEHLRLEVLATLGAVLIDSGAWRDAKSLLTAALDEVRQSGDRRLEALIRVRVCLLKLNTLGFTDNRDALPELERCVEVFDAVGDDSGLAETWALIGSIHFWSGRAAVGAEAADRAVAHALQADDRRRAAEALQVRAMAESEGPTPVADVAAHCESLMRAEAASDRVLRTAVTANRAEAEAARGNFDLARALASEAKVIAEELGLEVLYANRALRAAGQVAMLAGELRNAEREFRAAADHLRKIGDVGHLSSIAPLCADVLYAQGRYDEALALTEESRQLTMVGDVDAEVNWRRVQAKVFARQGRMDEAVRLATEAVALGSPTDYLSLRGRACADLAEVLGLAGQADGAAAALRQALELFERKGNVVLAQRVEALLRKSAPEL
jgi:tetratricopeptide (TPR) repeat protein